MPIGRIHTSIRATLPDKLRMEFSQHDLSRRFCTELFDRMGYSYDLLEGPNEQGSDLVVTVGNPLLGELVEFRIGVQVFAYEGEVGRKDFSRKLQQLIDGWDVNGLNFGVLITTAQCGDEIIEQLQEHNQNSPERRVNLIDGASLANLFLRYFPPDVELNP